MNTSFYSEERKNRLAELQIQKRRLEKRYFYCMLTAAANILPVAVYAWLTVVQAAGGERSPAAAFFAIAASIAAEVLMILGIYRKSWKLTAASTVCLTLWCIFLLLLPSILPFCINAAVCWVHRDWERLKEEDGFPSFDCAPEEHQEHVQQIRQIEQTLTAARAEEQRRRGNGMETI